ncbi:MAG: cyclase family protein [Gammaproteobacteria bacterium]|nr:cyclase family protein [Gammaproteobacteria bacterium]
MKLITPTKLMRKEPKMFGFLILLWCGLFAGQTIAQSSHEVTAEMVETWMTELSNWGRWGAEDELGALNLITPEIRVQAAQLVRSGVSVSLAHNYSQGVGDNPEPPFDHHLTGGGDQGPFFMERVSFSFHGGLHTHMDALCHMFHKGKMYNGFPQEAVDETGCSKLGITAPKQGIMTRGVLMDIAKLKGVDYLAPGTPIYVEDLEAWEQQTGLMVRSGDVLLVRTGRWATPEGAGQGTVGLHASVAPWLKERGVVMIGGDYFNDVTPSGVEGVALPIHQLALVAMGIWLFDNLDLEALAVEATTQQRWEFLLTGAPIPVEGGTGSPFNPIATF